ncbi:C4-dicarboxylate ABC transporter permease [Salinicoccus sediminis]|uniref:C4-dicarboxylate ABC transporter permease n=1 Tax=Salinicoccus sediminis TaxID=1432562 RepID=A0A0M2SF46_9STAP|nr:TRAP transporter large permease [Salinicoccus sediminis]KKK32893.1 C4-dicarboxylate ABC transporter permease [Salinicoccus sediminis]
MGYLLVLLFIILLVIGVPIAFVIGIVALLGMMTIPDIPEVIIPMKMVNGLDSFVLLAVPLFILAANLMNSGKISEKMIDLALAIVGPLKGGLAQANVLVSMIFAGVSGAAQADTAGTGKVLIPSMLKNGYDRETAVGVTAASSTIGVVIPPSIPMIIFAGVANASVGTLFLGGIIPGILIGLGMMIFIYFLSVKKGYPTFKRVHLKEIGKKFLDTFPALLTIIIIIGGIMTGLFTATESAAIASVYTLLISMFYYKTLKIRDLPKIIFDTLSLSALSLFALATASALGELLSYYQLATLAQTFFTENISMKWVFLLLIIGFFLIIGTFMDAIPAMILFVPIILPASEAFGIDPVHLGLIVIITLAVGLATPPYGLCLLIASKIGGLSIERSFTAVIPYLLIIVAVLLLIAFVPGLVFIIPDMMAGGAE